MSRMRTAVGAIAFVALAGCTQPSDGEHGYVPRLVISSSQPNARVVSNQDTSQISVDFGPVVLGTTVLETLVFSNVSGADATFLRVSTDTTDPSFSTDLPVGEQVLAGGPAVPVTLRFTPDSLGVKGAKITVTTDSSLVPTIEFTLTGRGV